MILEPILKIITADKQNYLKTTKAQRNKTKRKKPDKKAGKELMKI